MSKQRIFEMETTRSQYKAIKKMDHQQLNIFVDDIYKKGNLAGYDAGYDAGYHQGFKIASEKSAKQLARGEVDNIISESIDDLMGTIGEIKGIGPKKLEEIRAAIQKEAGA